MQLISVLVVLSGLLIPVLAAAPFYVLDNRAEKRTAEQEVAQRRLARLRTSESETAVDDAAAIQPVAGMAGAADDGLEQAAVAGAVAEASTGETVAQQETAEADEDGDTVVHELQFPTQPTSYSIEDENPVQDSVDHDAIVHCDAA